MTTNLDLAIKNNIYVLAQRGVFIRNPIYYG
jgi:hypothetical protein